MSTPYELEGSIKEIMETKTFPSGFCKREFVVTDEDDRYPQDIKLSMVKNYCALLDTVKPGDRVRVTFSLRGNLYQERYFTDLQAFKLEKLETDGSTSEPIPQPADDFPVDKISDDDMPF
ncbi:MAG: DUF3127 domain-containing protein [Kiritimatiellia bacterium]